MKFHPWRTVTWQLFCVSTLFGICLALNMKGTIFGQGRMPFILLSKFAFQKTDPADVERSSGYIYGNVTSVGPKPKTNSNGSYFVLMDSSNYWNIAKLKNYGDEVCQSILSGVSKTGFDRRCFPTGVQDFFRSVPCRREKLCDEEDDPANVIAHHQFTFRVQDTSRPRFWYLLFVDCYLNASCRWVRNQDHSQALYYDIWLVNGHPNWSSQNPFEHQFSVDQQDLFEVCLVAVAVYLVITVLQAKAFCQRRRLVDALLLVAVFLKDCQYSFCLSHYSIFAAFGRTSAGLTTFGEMCYVLSDSLTVLLVVFVAKGLSVSCAVFFPSLKFTERRRTCIFVLFTGLPDAVRLPLMETWPGWLMLMIRVIGMSWFLATVRQSLKREENERKATFLLHFGSGFLVWFIYVPVLATISLKIPPMWRQKVTTGIIFLVDFFAASALVQILWPTGTTNYMFLDDRRPVIGQEWEDYEKAEICAPDRNDR